MSRNQGRGSGPNQARPGDTAPSSESALPLTVRRRIDLLIEACRSGTLLEYLGLPAGSPTSATLDRLRQAETALAHAAGRFDFGDHRSSVSDLQAVIRQVIRSLEDPRTGVHTSPWRYRRQKRRFPFAVPIRVSSPVIPHPVDAYTSDVSSSGAFVVCEMPIPRGAPVEIELGASPEGTTSIPAKVMWRRAASDSIKSGFGIKLAFRSDQQRSSFDQVLRSAQIAQPSPFGDKRRRRRSDSAIIGIDLGTTYTYMSAAQGNQVGLLPFADGSFALSSIVNFPSQGTARVGELARRCLETDPHHTVASAKRLLGRQVVERDVANHLAQVPYQVQEGPDQTPVVVMWGERFAIPQVCSYLLGHVKDSAERALGCRVERAVLSVPVSFSRDQVRLLRTAAQLAQLEVVDVVEEPNAAAVANMRDEDFGGLIGVYDFGGGTFDFSVVDARKGDFQVLATAGDSWLGGDDFDMTLAEAIANLLWRKHKIELRHRAVEWQRLLHSCERAKRSLASEPSARIHVPEVTRTVSGSHGLNYTLKRPQAAALWGPLITRSLTTCNQTLSLLGIRPTQLRAIYLSGGTTYLPVVRSALARLGVPVRTVVPPQSAVCLGTGVHAAQLERRSSTTLTGSAAL